MRSYYQNQYIAAWLQCTVLYDVIQGIHSIAMSALSRDEDDDEESAQLILHCTVLQHALRDCDAIACL